MLFSVILPYYNGKKYIQEAIESVVNQSFDDWELIIVDDGSDQENADYLTDFVTKLSSNKIKILRKKNEDVAVARNFGIENAIGEYICLLDQDDFFDLNKLYEISQDILKNPRIDAHISNRYKITKSGTEKDLRAAKQKTKALEGNIIPNVLFNPGIMPVETVIRKKNIISLGAYDRSLRMSNDWDMIVRLAKSNATFYYNELYLAYYRLHDDNTSRKHEGFVKERFSVLDKFFKDADESVLKYKNKAYAMAYLESANPRYKSRMIREFRTDVHKIIKLSPSVLTTKLCLRYLKSFFV
jgi:glycosyltransferase involved in cell wall biosynthesis